MINRLIILSPHFDDAIFSVGGLLAACSSQFKSMIVVNIFTSNPPKELTPQAKLFHRRYIDENPVAIRCMLDQRAYSHYNIEIINLDFLDAIYRFDVINKKPNYLDPIDIFSTVNPNFIKAWHKHKEATLNYACIKGKVKFVLFDDRKNSSTYGVTQELILSQDNYFLVTVPPMIWNGFMGIYKESSIIANCMTIPHNENEMIRKDYFDKEFSYNWNLNANNC